MQNNKIKKEEVIKFLSSFREKRRTFEIIFIDRPKNKQSLLDLEIRPVDREKFIDQLTVEDFSEGPLPEDWYGSKEMWVFGKGIKGREVYIKICLGAPNSNLICISFHIAAYPMKYPFRP
ncbi:hypothetical protein [Algoriphagus sp.]|uniref:hypothetical protein n=1 Tax=Algoriphagus sp. TaxID=1872435 RepID=UPI00260EC3EA|nr:hypothetical protein [Algoriphagus sp.]